MTHTIKALIALIVVLISNFCIAKVKTTRDNVSSSQATTEKALIAPTNTIQTKDTTSTRFNTNAITIKGFSKRASDWKESFFATNNTSHKISHITLTLRYSDMSGNMLHERTITVNCNLKPSETKQIKIQSFDTQSEFYYYASSKPRKKASPFQVSVHIVSYNIPIENPNN